MAEITGWCAESEPSRDGLRVRIRGELGSSAVYTRTADGWYVYDWINRSDRPSAGHEVDHNHGEGTADGLDQLLDAHPVLRRFWRKMLGLPELDPPVDAFGRLFMAAAADRWRHDDWSEIGPAMDWVLAHYDVREKTP